MLAGRCLAIPIFFLIMLGVLAIPEITYRTISILQPIESKIETELEWKKIGPVENFDITNDLISFSRIKNGYSAAILSKKLPPPNNESRLVRVSFKAKETVKNLEPTTHPVKEGILTLSYFDSNSIKIKVDIIEHFHLKNSDTQRSIVRKIYPKTSRVEFGILGRNSYSNYTLSGLKIELLEKRTFYIVASIALASIAVAYLLLTLYRVHKTIKLKTRILHTYGFLVMILLLVSSLFVDIERMLEAVQISTKPELAFLTNASHYVAHFMIFSISTLLVYRICTRLNISTKYVFYLAVYLCILTETIQLHFTSRTFSIYDIFCNLLGISFAIGLISVYRIFSLRKYTT